MHRVTNGMTSGMTLGAGILIVKIVDLCLVGKLRVEAGIRATGE
jgi:hypothetical protein